jgi:hypothetical protein
VPILKSAPGICAASTSTPRCVSEAMTLTGDILSSEGRTELLVPMYLYLLTWFFLYCYPIARATVAVALSPPGLNHRSMCAIASITSSKSHCSLSHSCFPFVEILAAAD